MSWNTFNQRQYKIDGISCYGCVKRVMTALEHSLLWQKVELDFPTKILKVSFLPEIDEKVINLEISKKMEELGMDIGEASDV